MRSLDALFAKHSQRHKWSCAASAHEFIAKIHGKIGDSEFPLQDGPLGQKGGFTFEAFLNTIGFTGKDGHAAPADLLPRLLSETAVGRYPLVSILAGLDTSASYWHIVVAVPVGEEIGLVDPARRCFIANDSAETLDLLLRVSVEAPNRSMIHFLAYRELAMSP